MQHCRNVDWPYMHFIVYDEMSVTGKLRYEDLCISAERYLVKKNGKVKRGAGESAFQDSTEVPYIVWDFFYEKRTWKEP